MVEANPGQPQLNEREFYDINYGSDLGRIGNTGASLINLPTMSTD